MKLSHALLFLLALVLSVRIFIVFSTDFPLNDGGLFFTMTNDLKQNHFFIPKYTSYNNDSIPFAYPPLAFYVIGFVTFLPFITLPTVFHMLPLFLNIASLFVFYLLAKKLLKSGEKALLTSFFFASLPYSYFWMLMGGGVTRSLGLLFSLLATLFFLSLVTSPSKKSFLLTSVFCSFAVLSHMEWGLLTVWTLVLVAFFFPPFKRNVFLLLLILCISSVTTSIWWGQVALFHGLSPFLAASKTASWSLYPFFNIITFHFSFERFFPLSAFLGLFGIIGFLKKKQYFFPVLLISTLLLVPRSMPHYIPLSFLATEGLFFLTLLPFNFGKQNIKTTHIHTFPKILFLLLFYTAILNALGLYFFTNPTLLSVNREDRNAMKWVLENTVRNAKFLVVIPESFDHWSHHKVTEWFPALTERTNVLTIQGHEWIQGEIGKREIQNSKLSECKSEKIECFENWSKENNVPFSHIYTYSKIDTSSCCKTLYQSLVKSKNYVKLYEKNGIAVFKNAPQSDDSTFSE